MKSTKIITLAVFLVSFLSFTNDDPDCSIMHEGKFKYVDFAPDPNLYFEIKGDTHTEYHEDGKYVMVSTIKWVNDCEYTLKLQSSTDPNFDLRKGTKLRVTILKVEGKIITYRAKIKGDSWEGKLEKISD